MIYGYSSERPGCCITHVTGFDNNTITQMSELYYRYDNESDNNQASFIHLTKKERDQFVINFDIILVESKNELQFLKKMMSDT